MATVKQNRRPAAPANGSPSVESVLETVRAVWSAAERAEDAEQAKHKKDITQTVSRLKSRVEGHLGKPVAATKERSLFDQEERSPVVAVDAPATPRFPDPTLRIYAKDLTEHALKHIPKLACCKSIDNIRKYLTDKLSFNSQATRRRNVNYLISRYFPGEVVHPEVAPFAAAVEGQPALGDALFYFTCRMEKIVALVAEQIVFPSLALGGVSRTKIRDFVQAQFPNSKSAKQIGVAVVGTYQTFGVANATRTKLNVSLREGSLAAFAYVLHLEFPEPGMYSFEKMLNGSMHKCLLWDQQWMVRQLYVLREAGMMSKVAL
ncbi:MAG: hypothetical protein R3B84_14085 [Zavarzinella sp.]